METVGRILNGLGANSVNLTHLAHAYKSDGTSGLFKNLASNVMKKVDLDGVVHIGESLLKKVSHRAIAFTDPGNRNMVAIADTIDEHRVNEQLKDDEIEDFLTEDNKVILELAENELRTDNVLAAEMKRVAVAQEVSERADAQIAEKLNELDAALVADENYSDDVLASLVKGLSEIRHDFNDLNTFEKVTTIANTVSDGASVVGSFFSGIPFLGGLVNGISKAAALIAKSSAAFSSIRSPQTRAISNVESLVNAGFDHKVVEALNTGALPHVGPISNRQALDLVQEMRPVIKEITEQAALPTLDGIDRNVHDAQSLVHYRHTGWSCWRMITHPGHLSEISLFMYWPNEASDVIYLILLDSGLHAITHTFGQRGKYHGSAEDAAQNFIEGYCRARERALQDIHTNTINFDAMTSNRDPHMAFNILSVREIEPRLTFASFVCHDPADTAHGKFHWLAEHSGSLTAGMSSSEARTIIANVLADRVTIHDKGIITTDLVAGRGPAIEEID